MISKGNILILTQWSFKDALIQTYTLPYVEIIRELIAGERKIILISSEQEKIALNKVEIETLNKKWESRNMKLVAFPYNRFGLKKIFFFFGHLIKMFLLIKKKNISIIHAFGTPAGGAAFLLSKLSGAQLIVDSYEPHAEAMVENGTWKRSSIAFKILFALEKKQTRFASVLIGTTEGMKKYALEKYRVAVTNFFVKPACVSLEKFFPAEKYSILLKKLDIENKIVCVYAGKLGGIYFKEEVFDFINACYKYWKNDFRFLLLTNASNEEINFEMERAGIPADIVRSQFVFHDEITQYLSLADFAINPVKPVPTKRYCTSIKDGEYWAMGLPVIISSGISDDSEIIQQNGIGIEINFQNKEGREKAVKYIAELLKRNTRKELQNKIVEIAKAYRSMEIARRVYSLIYANN